MKLIHLMLLSTVACPAWAQDYQITSFTIGAGGDSNLAAGTYTLSGTIGQPDAGAILISSSYELQGGFWPTISGHACLADFAAPFGELDFFDVSAFITGFSGMDPMSDMNNDGVFNFFDVSAFLVSFSQGCP